MTVPKPAALSMLTEEQAAEYISMSTHYLRCDRYRGTTRGHTPGPRFLKLGRNKVRYRICDLDEWIASRVVERKAESAKRPRLRKSAAA
jgi:predicted DNA-binding transcriptional regulator AlpA